MKLKNIYLSTLIGAGFATLGLTGCADELSVPTPEVETPDGIVLRIPNLEAAAEFPESRAVSATTANEGRLNSLYLFIFEQKDGNSKPLDGYPIDIKGKNNIGNELTSAAYKDYSLNLLGGTYKMYLLANLEDYVTGGAETIEALQTEADIKALTLNFNGPLTNGNLPMACLSVIEKSTSGSAVTPSVEKAVTVEAGESAVIYADLSFLCSKVRYTVLFDNDKTNGISRAFGDKVVDFSNPTIANILTETPIVGTSSNTDGAKSSTLTLTKYTYPEETDYPKSSASPDLSGDQYNANKLAWQGIVYLPENVSNKKTTITLKGAVYKSATEMTANDKVYDLPTKVTTLCPDGVNGGKFERGKMYDVAITVKNYDGLDVSVTAAPWETTSILADFVHTYLTLERTTASVTSENSDVITFDTDGRGGIKFTCDNNGLKNKSNADITTPVILSVINEEDKTITFSVNPKVLISEVNTNNTEGTAICWIQAGNIRKKMEIKYDLTPLFEIEPSVVTIKYENGSASTVSFHYKTNLGGVVIKKRGSSEVFFSKTDTSKDDTQKISFLNDQGQTTSGDNTINFSRTSSENNLSEDDIIVSSKNDPRTTVHYYYTAFAVDDESYKQNLEVKIISTKSAYRIYFRAINDQNMRENDNNSNNNTGFPWWKEGDDNWVSKWPTEDTRSYTQGSNTPSNNWADGWGDDYRDSRYHNDNRHRLYVYAQEGETKVSGTGNNDIKTWNFTEAYWNNGSAAGWVMKADETNPGWFYYDLYANMTKTAHGITKNITPGETMLIFYNGEFDGACTHRCPHHNDPGLPLFDFEDHEGWILYDPTCEPYYKIFDEKPEIKDIEYTVYYPTSYNITGWFRQYGVDEDKTLYQDPKKFTKWSKSANFTSSGTSGSWKYIKFKLKAPEEYTEKAIMFDGLGQTKIPRVMLGAVNDNSWHNPLVEFHNGTKISEKYQMQLARIDGTDYYYYYDVPEDYRSTTTYCIFYKKDNSAILNWGNNYKVDFNYKKCTWTNAHEQWLDNQGALDNISPMLFDGASFENNTGYYKNGTWSEKSF